MATQIQSLSVFFPCYNEEKEIKNTVAKAKKVLEKVAKNWEIIIVNDGSKDKTAEIAKALSTRDKRIRVVTHNPNRGYGAAFKSGLYAAKYPWIAFTDADGQFDFSEITEFIKTQKETNADCVIGYYRKRQVPFYRKVNTYLWQIIVWMLFGLNVRDIDCGFKLIGKHVVDKIPKLESERGAFISSEFLINASKKKFKIIEIPVHHYPRTTGSGTGSNIDVIIKSFVDLFTLWRKLR
jgi:glycosyltransferase involved in cell wall biosynthesis